MESRRSQSSRVTLKDVAERVGVSIGTASVVLNGSRSGSHISENTRQELLRTAEELRYRPSGIARNLLEGRTYTIAIVPSSADRDLLLGPHLQQVLNAAANILEDQGYDMLLLTRCDQGNADSVIRALTDGRVDGALLVSPRSDSSLIAQLKMEALPFVVIDADPEPGLAAFRVDDVAGVEATVEYLAGLGHKRIAHIAGTPTLSAAVRRQVAFEGALAMRGIDLPAKYIQCGGFGPAGGGAAMRILMSLPVPPTAVICANDEAAMGAMSEARSMGLLIPADVSVTGFDDGPLSHFCDPPLTTVHHPIRVIAEAATTTLFQLLSGETPTSPSLFPCNLVVRGSAACPYTTKQ